MKQKIVEIKRNVATTLNENEINKLKNIASLYDRKVSDYLRVLIRAEIKKEERKHGNKIAKSIDQ